MNHMKLYLLFGIVFVSILGSLAHFFYEWSGMNPVVGLFCPVNESTWEHMKLLFFPMLLYDFILRMKLGPAGTAVTGALLVGILAGSALIPVIFYTYTGVLGYHTLLLDIMTFIVSVMAAFCISYSLILSRGAAGYELLLKIAVTVTAAAFWIFTYVPPEIGLFRDPTM